MGSLIEDYGLIGDTHTAALVGRDGSIDWLCLPRFDSAACFAHLIGDHRPRLLADRAGREPPPGQGEPLRPRAASTVEDTLVLETEFDPPTGTVRITDCMPVREHTPRSSAWSSALTGAVDMRMDLVLRFGYGSVVPWVRHLDGMLVAIAGPDGLALWTHGRDPRREHAHRLRVHLTRGPAGSLRAHLFPFTRARPPAPSPPGTRSRRPTAGGRSGRTCHLRAATCARRRVRSLITLKALTYEPTGGIVAAATTSLPESLGGERNWDYRYCWLRDATLTLSALMAAGYHDEAVAWRDWLLRAAAGDPSQAADHVRGRPGSGASTSRTLDWLPGYEGSRPVRIGNAASGQYQLDVYGEVIRRCSAPPRTPASTAGPSGTSRPGSSSSSKPLKGYPPSLGLGKDATPGMLGFNLFSHTLARAMIVAWAER